VCGTGAAALAAQSEGRTPELCLPNSPFNLELQECDLCIEDHATNGTTAIAVTAIPEFEQYLSYCETDAEVSSFYSLLSVENSLASIQASLCSVNNITSDCSASQSNNTTLAATSSASTATQIISSSLNPTNSSTSTITSSSSTATQIKSSSLYLTNSSTSTITSFQATTQSPPLRGGTIAGVAIGCTLAFVFIIGFLIFFFLHRRKQRRQRVIEQAEAANVQEVEKAQLHSEDLKPTRNELAGDQPLVLERHVPVAEMPANWDPRWTMGEMPANEIAGSVLQSKKYETFFDG